MLLGHGDDMYAYPHIRLNFSSNVYGHFDHSGLYAHLAKHMDVVTSYPEPDAARLEGVLADNLGLAPSQVMATAGATEAIYLVAQAYAGGRSIISSPTFAEYEDACRMYGHECKNIYEGLSACEALAESRGIVWLCCPNNPTGTVEQREDLLRAIDGAGDTLFVVDASYAPFTREPLVSVAEAAARENVVMLHSMTKRFSVPGLRLGYVTAHAKLLGRLRLLQRPWSIDAIAQEAGVYLLSHAKDYSLPLDMLLGERRRIAASLSALGLAVHRSDTHILLCRLAHGNASALKERLASRHGILIRDASNFHGLTSAHFRIAAQTPDENDALLAAMQEEVQPGQK